jgi:hypothetical protein
MAAITVIYIVLGHSSSSTSMSVTPVVEGVQLGHTPVTIGYLHTYYFVCFLQYIRVLTNCFVSTKKKRALPSRRLRILVDSKYHSSIC